MNKEIWEPIVGYESLYEVSNFGNVKSLRSNKKLKPAKSNGYPQCVLSKNNIAKTFNIHRLVAETFIQNIFSKKYVNHIDSNRSNNNVSNLEWCTQKENIQHAIKQGRMIGFYSGKRHVIKSFGENNRTAKLKEKDILEIRKSKLMQKELAIIYGVARCTISQIVNYKKWKHI